MKLYERRSDKQLIRLVRDPVDGVVLELDGMMQFVESDEHRYHECLAVVPLLFASPARIFIAGGGDGLAAARLLKFDCVEHITLCEHDALVLELARRQEDMLRLNEGAFSDPRVTTITGDAVAYLERTDERFDLVMCDFPDPYTTVLDGLYTTTFYETVRRRLAPGGMLVVQTTPVPEIARVVRATVGEVFPHSAFTYTFYHHAFTFGLEEPLARARGVPEWARFLTDEMVPGLFALPRDLAKAFAPRPVDVNHPGTYRAVKAGMWELNAAQMMKAYPFRRGFQMFLLIDEPDEQSGAEEIGLFLEAAHEASPLVVLANASEASRHGARLQRLGYKPVSGYLSGHTLTLDDAAHKLRSARWMELDDGSVATLHARYTRPSDDDEIRTMLERYLARGTPRMFVVPESSFDPRERARYVTTRDAHGAAVALCKAVDVPSQDNDVVELEVMFCLAGVLQARLSLMLMLNYLEKNGVKHVECIGLDPEIGRELTALGAERIAPVRAMVATGTATSATS